MRWFNLAYLLWAIIFGAGTYILFTLNSKMKKIKQLQAQVKKLNSSLEEMDEQAKLIVRTDIELNRTQEELDKKLMGLYSLQKLSRQISTTMEEEIIFSKISNSHLEDLGFHKACGFLWNYTEEKFSLQLYIGYPQDYLENINAAIDLDKHTYLDLIKNVKILSSVSGSVDKKTKDKINSVFAVNSFIISPILPKEGAQGFFFVGTEDKDITLSEADEELINLLTNQIGQALENARLFEKSYKAQQDLEKKVEQRTRALSDALEEVKRASQRKTDFISSVSHELRTPLTSIKGYAAILLEEKLGKLPAAAKERLERVNRHSNELVNIVNDLLDIARIESGKTLMRLQKTNLNDIIAAASDLIAIQCKNKNIELSQDLPRVSPEILVDHAQIERVFINLLGNAVKFTPSGGKISIKAYKNDEDIQISVTDTGMGIPAEALSNIFDEFYRVDNEVNQQVKGTGLGLSLVKHIIQAHKGRIWAESKEGEGSTFFFTLPLK